MHVNAALVVLAASCPLAFAAPAGSVAPGRGSLRLVKTSEQDPGQWVDEKDFWSKFTSKGITFIDITDVEDKEVLAVLSGQTGSASLAKIAATYPSGPQHVEEANKLISQSNTNGPQSWLKSLTSFHTRHYQSSTGLEASNWLFDQVKKTAAANSAITVKQFKHRFNQPSIIAQLPGESSNLVIVGAHMDSTVGSPSARSPGADDNGSGSVTILEALRVIASSGIKPKNTLEFHWYAGEEGGLLGSKEVYANYKQTGKKVTAFLNQDMTGYSPNKRPAVFTDNVDVPLTTYVRTIVKQYTGLEPSTSRCGYGCSDHASGRSNGFPSAFVGEDTFDAMNPNIHSSRDSLEKIDWSAVHRHVKLTIGFLVEASYVVG
ncbi:Bacterial leucyl aminopeptidase [Purpureocillium takamizusanense]|uniref:Peptide hydrolase n=1 Tax=Purpureocillium takamizusanense TaxID=2060973 RepID=A0A9Q8V811_9HYPO|nr:Bacterial leucyl aminopeptidase [Purpureocillium takamizusanense]UNI16595.1 Bacterial leucyl aminopeptidase [Purpureocillium takamizusanense]